MSGLSDGLPVNCERCGSQGSLRTDGAGWAVVWSEVSMRAREPDCITDSWSRAHWTTAFSVIGLDGQCVLRAGVGAQRVVLVRRG